MIKITTLRALGDNFIHGVEAAGRALVVDPGEAAPVERYLAEQGLELERILITHGHRDHTGGCERLRQATGCRVTGPGLGEAARDGDVIAFGEHRIRVLAVPGHTREHVAYVVDDDGAVFTGDTLFQGGCGRLFECDAATLWASLCRLRALAPSCRVYCGHDYTEDNLDFARTIEPGNAAVRTRWEAACRGTAPGSTMGEERVTNPFLRADDPVLQEALGMSGEWPAAVFAELRRRKDEW